MYLLEHLHYESRRAHVFGLSQRLEDAENRACQVFSLQVRAYKRGRQTLGLGYKPTPKSRGWLLSLEEVDPSPKPVVTLEDGIRAVELEDDLESALDMLSDGHGNRVHPVQVEEDLGGEKPAVAVPKSEDLFLSRIFVVVSQEPSETKELGQEIRQILAEGNTDITKQQRLRARFSKLRVHPWLLETLHSLAFIKLQRQSPPDPVVCRMLEIVQKWRRRIFSESHDMTMAAAHDLARAHRFSGRFLDAKTGVEKVLAVRKKQLGNWHLNSLVTQRELIISSCAMKIPPSAWDSPALASTLEFVGPRPASPKDSTPKSYALKKLHDDTWSYKGSLLEMYNYGKTGHGGKPRARPSRDADV